MATLAFDDCKNVAKKTSVITTCANLFRGDLTPPDIFWFGHKNHLSFEKLPNLFSPQITPVIGEWPKAVFMMISVKIGPMFC